MNPPARAPQCATERAASGMQLHCPRSTMHHPTTCKEKSHALDPCLLRPGAENKKGRSHTMREDDPRHVPRRNVCCWAAHDLCHYSYKLRTPHVRTRGCSGISPLAGAPKSRAPPRRQSANTARSSGRADHSCARISRGRPARTAPRSAAASPTTQDNHMHWSKKSRALPRRRPAGVS